MNMDQIMYDLTYWFDYTMRMVLHHPLTSLIAVVGAFLFHQALGALFHQLRRNEADYQRNHLRSNWAYGSFVRLAHVLTSPPRFLLVSPR